MSAAVSTAGGPAGVHPAVQPAVHPGRHSARARRALVHLATDDPALAALALWCAHRDAAEGPAARTEGATIFYGPAFETLAPHEQVGLAAHHVLHVALRHGPRMGAMAARLGDGFDAPLFGLAADALVNAALVQAGYGLPRPAVVLDDLLTRALGLPGGPAALADWDAERLYLRLAGQGGGRGAAGEGGGKAPAPAAEEARRIAAEAGFAPDLTQGAPDAENPEGADQAALWRQHLSRALEAGRVSGRGIGLLGHRIADLPVPRTPWELVLRRLLMRALLPGRAVTHRRPARDWIAAEALARAAGGPVPAFRPGVRRQLDVPRLALAVDASGSVDDGLLARLTAEVCGIARRMAAEITLIAFDDGVRWQVRLDAARGPAQIAALDWPRGGGTDFAPPIAAAQAMGASAVVILSDLDGPFGPPPRGMPVIWASPDDAPAPPFGRLISLAR